MQYSSMASNSGFGILGTSKSLTTGFDFDADLYEIQWWGGGNTLQTYHTAATSLSTVCTTSDILQMAVKGGNVWIGKNDTWFGSGNPSTGANPYWTGLTGKFSPQALHGNVKLNFGQTAFTYTPPSGFKRLSTANLPAPTIKRASSHFNRGFRHRRRLPTHSVD
jgi:hypothetical protein